MSKAGLVTVASANDFTDTITGLETALHGKAATVFAVFDHAAGATDVGLALRPTTVVMFGNPAAAHG